MTRGIKLKRKIYFITLILCLLLIPSFYQKSPNSVVSKTEDIVKPVSIQLPDDPFVIDQNNQFTLYASGGDGSEQTPWEIRDLYIDTLGQEGIWIKDTTDYFMIVNCTVGANLYSIRIENVATGTALIRNCTLDGGSRGVGFLDTSGNTVMDCVAYSCSTAGYYMSNASDTLVYENIVYNSGKGIFVLNSPGVDAFYNEVYDSTYNHGIQVENSNEVAVQYNIADGNSHNGINIENSTDAYVGFNNCSDNYYRGVQLIDANYALVEGNRFHACDLGVEDDSLEDLLTYDIRWDNTIDDLTIFYGENLEDFVISSKFPQIILINCTNVDILDQDLLAQHIYTPIFIIFSDDIRIERCFIENCIGGIYAAFGSEIVILDCSILNNMVGLAIIDIAGGLIQYNTIINATISGTMMTMDSDNFEIIDNHYENIGYYCIRLDAEVSNTLIYHNNFINGSYDFSTYGLDEGTNNFWYSETLQEGNYWDDWVSGNYSIAGAANSWDIYPIGSVQVIPEFSEMGTYLSLLTILSFVSVSFLIKRRR